MSRVQGANIVSTIRLDNSRLRADARQTQTTLRQLVRGIGTSSGPDPFVNAIGRIGPAAAGALAGLKAVEAGFAVYVNRRDAAAAKLRGDIEGEIKAERGFRDFFDSLPIIGPLGATIREARTGDQAYLDKMKFETAQQEKLSDFAEKRWKAQLQSTKAAKDLARTTEREVAMLNKSPRRREIMEAQHALEDYKRELDELQKQTKLPLSDEQNAAVSALEKRVEAIKNKRGQAQWTDMVSAARDAQIAILNNEEWGAKQRVGVAEKEGKAKQKARDGEAVPTVRNRDYYKGRKAQLEMEVASVDRALQFDPNNQQLIRRRNKLADERRQARKIDQYGTENLANEQFQNKQEIRTLRDRQNRARKMLRERQEKEIENSVQGQAVKADPSNSVTRGIFDEWVKPVRERQMRERQEMDDQFKRETQDYEERFKRRNERNEFGRSAEEQRLNSPVDTIREGLREGFRMLFPRVGGPKGEAPRKGDAGDEAAKKLGTASEKLDKAAGNLSKMQTVGVIK